MKKLKSLFLLLVTFVMMAITPQSVWAAGTKPTSGDGSSGRPYQIASEANLIWFRDAVNGVNTGTGTGVGICGKLTQNITLTSAWTTIGTSNRIYTGTFDGQGHTISGLNLTATAANAGFFGYVNGATIKNFSLAGTVSSGYDNTGSVVGYAKGSSTIQDIVSTVNITMTAAKSHLGGIAGNIENGTSVLDCTYSGTLDAGSSTDSNGGIVGFANANCSGTIKNCFFNGTVKTTGSGPQMGGILGYTNDTDKNFGGVQNCYSCGTLTFTGSDNYANAIVGRIRAKSSTTINNTFLSGTATRACNTDCSDPVDFTKNKAITISVTAGSNGKVSQSYVNPTSTTATQLQVVATPNAHYHLNKWSDNGAQTHNVGLTANVSLSASFAIDQHTISVATNNSNYGTVSGGGTFDYNSTKTITATPKEHYHFVKWNDGNTNASRQITVTEDKTYTATFAIDQHTITVATNNANYGTVSGGGTFNYGSTKTITATPKEHYHFVKWNDGNTNASRQITVTEDKTYTAQFNHKAKAVFDHGTLTFYYDGINHSGTTYELNTGSDDPGWYNQRSVYVTSIVIDPSFAEVRPTSCRNWFRGCDGVTSISGLEYLNTENVTNMCFMFSGCSNINSLDLSNFNTANVTDMQYMFNYCQKLQSLDLSSFNTASVTNMFSMFNSCSGLQSLIIDNFDMQSVNKKGGMFYGCSNLNTLTMKSVPFLADGSFNTQFTGDDKTVNLVLDENSQIYEGTNYLPTITNCNHYGHEHEVCPFCGYDPRTAKAVYNNGTLTFYCDAEEHVGTTYALNSGTNMPEWLNDNITAVVFDASFAVARPTTCKSWFSISSLNTISGLNNLNTSEVTNMSYMFYDCSSLQSLDLSSFNTGNVTRMDEMFRNCSSLQSLDLSSFNTGNVTRMEEMFYKCSSLQSLDLSSFNTGNVTDMTGMFGICANLQSLNLSSFNTGNVTGMTGMFENCASLQSLDLSSFNTEKVTSMSSMFSNCATLQSLDLSSFNTGKTKYISSMFFGCTNLESINFGNFNTSATSLSHMFYGCSSLTSLDLSSFSTSAVTDMTYMFDGCSALKSLNLSGFNTSAVTNMTYMFYDCSSLTSLDLSSFSTSAVTNMTYMFDGCSSLTSLDLSSFNTSTVRDMAYMFQGCSSLTALDLSGFNTSAVTEMSSMFHDCSSLTSLDLSSFSTSAVTSGISKMFSGCSSLISLDLSSFNTSSITNTADMFNNCANLEELTIGNFDMTKASASNMFANCSSLNTLTLKSIPFLKYGTFNIQFTGDGKTVNYELDDNSVIYTGATNYLPAASSASYTREMSNEWGTVVVPFEIVYNSNNGNYKLYQFESLNVYNIYFSEYTTGDVIAAGTPMAVKAVGSRNAAGKYEIVLEGNGTISTKINPSGDPVTFYMNGTYTALSNQTDIHFIAQNQFWWADAPITIAPFRAWIEEGENPDTGDPDYVDPNPEEPGNPEPEPNPDEPDDDYELNHDAAPTRLNIVVINNDEQIATSMDAINATADKAMKVMIDGQIFILKNGQMFDICGRKVK